MTVLSTTSPALHRGRSAFWLAKRVPLYVVLVGWLAVILGPYLIMLVTSVTPNAQLTQPGATLIPERVSTAAYSELLQQTPFAHYLANSLAVASATVVMCLIVALGAAIALSRYRFRGRIAVMSGVLAAQLFPAVLLVISLQGELRGLGLLDSRLGLALLNATFAMPFCTWLLKGFLDKIPRELEEAARIDGASTPQLIMRILLPLLWPGLVAAATYVFIFSWNEFIYAVTFTTSDAARTLPVGLQLLVGDYQIRWDLLTAGGVLAVIPVLVGFMLVQRRLVDGLTAGAVKG
jgi:multiple sugar transport system permease protein